MFCKNSNLSVILPVRFGPFMKKILQELDFFQRERSPRKWVISFLAGWFSLLFLWGGIVLFTDPYIVFHRTIGLKTAYRNPYAMLPGILRNEPYDTVLIGSSMCQNFELKDICDALGGDTIKATAPGLSGEDVDQFLQEIFKRNDVRLRRIIIGVDLWGYSSSRQAHWRDYHYLYQRQWSWEYFYSQNTAEAVFNLIVTNLASADTKGANLEKDRNRMFCDKLWRFKYSRKTFENAIRKNERMRPAPLNDAFVQNIDQRLISHIKAHPEVHFDLFLPPYSACFWSMQQEYGDITGYLNARLSLAQAVETLPNVSLHDFQDDTKIISDFDRYKDISHYNQKTNREILGSIARQDHKIASLAAMAAANQRLLKQAEMCLPYYRKCCGKTEK